MQRVVRAGAIPTTWGVSAAPAPMEALQGLPYPRRNDLWPGTYARQDTRIDSRNEIVLVSDLIAFGPAIQGAKPVTKSEADPLNFTIRLPLPLIA
jgi:hypothetical protein